MNITLSYNNHFKFGYNGNPFTFRTSANDSWWVRYGSCERQTGSFKAECINTAIQIRDSTSLPLWILFSGGIDSEIALKSFVEAKIPVRAAILRFKGDYNIHDISYAIITCENLGVPYTLFDLDVVKFWEERLFEYADPTQCITPHLLPTMYLVDQIDGYPILGSGECLFGKRVPHDYFPGVSPYLDSEWDLYEKEYVAAWYRHFMIRKRDGCPGFFQYTPEIILSYTLDPFVQRLINNEVVGKLWNVSTKSDIYAQHFQFIPRTKYTGYEKLIPISSQYTRILTSKYSHCNQVYKTPVKDLVQMLSHSKELSHGL